MQFSNFGLEKANIAKSKYAVHFAKLASKFNFFHQWSYIASLQLPLTCI